MRWPPQYPQRSASMSKVPDVILTGLKRRRAFPNAGADGPVAPKAVAEVSFEHGTKTQEAKELAFETKTREGQSALASIQALGDIAVWNVAR
jgi:hypothetical protein